MNINPLNAIDFYKADHRRQYPEGTQMVFANFTPRSSHLTNLTEEQDHVIFFGLQYFLTEYLSNSWNIGFFSKPKEEVVAAYKRRMDTSLGPDAIPMDHIEALHDLGYLPLEIRAVPEGSKVSIKVPCLTVHNTHPDFFWLVNYIESVLSCYLWKACVSATTANWYKKLLMDYAEKTGAPKDFVGFQGHDFSFRGMSGIQDAMLSGAAHLTSFVGTDSVPAIDFLEEYYGADAEKELIGCSVPATEHSVMCMGTKESEIETFRRLITDLYPSGIVSIVSDTWDFWKVITEYLPELKDTIMAREGNPIANKVVIRPDSGDPVKIICGEMYNSYDTIEEAKEAEYDLMHDTARDACEGSYCLGEDSYTHICKVGDEFYKITGYFSYDRHDKTYYYIDNYGVDETKAELFTPTPEFKGAIECLWDTFGGTVNEKGYKELDSHIGLIYGDSITPQRAKDILDGLEAKGFASTNVVFGIGSYTYQYTTRDTYGFAVKATYGKVNGEGRDIFKDPATDNGLKKSAKGLLKVVNGELIDELSEQVWNMRQDCDLLTVFRDGYLFNQTNLADIRERLCS